MAELSINSGSQTAFSLPRIHETGQTVDFDLRISKKQEQSSCYKLTDEI